MNDESIRRIVNKKFDDHMSLPFDILFNGVMIIMLYILTGFWKYLVGGLVAYMIIKISTKKILYYRAKSFMEV